MSQGSGLLRCQNRGKKPPGTLPATIVELLTQTHSVTKNLENSTLAGALFRSAKIYPKPAACEGIPKKNSTSKYHQIPSFWAMKGWIGIRAESAWVFDKTKKEKYISSPKNLLLKS